MGCFSWLDCKSGKQIKIGSDKPVYMLIPKEFKNVYGTSRVEETCYDGYGRFGGYDVFEEVADWNKGLIGEANLKPMPRMEEYGGLWKHQIEELKQQGVSDKEIAEKDRESRIKPYRAAIARRKMSISRIIDFNTDAATDEEMVEMYGSHWHREIGIDVACYDDQNAALTYPIKLTYDKNAVYEDCKPSNGDPDQGF